VGTINTVSSFLGNSQGGSAQVGCRGIAWFGRPHVGDDVLAGAVAIGAGKTAEHGHCPSSPASGGRTSEKLQSTRHPLTEAPKPPQPSTEQGLASDVAGDLAVSSRHGCQKLSAFSFQRPEVRSRGTTHQQNDATTREAECSQFSLGLPLSNVRCPTSDFRLPTCDVRLPISALPSGLFPYFREPCSARRTPGIMPRPVMLAVRTDLVAHRAVRTVAGTPGGRFWCAHTPRMAQRAPRAKCAVPSTEYRGRWSEYRKRIRLPTDNGPLTTDDRPPTTGKSLDSRLRGNDDGAAASPNPQSPIPNPQSPSLTADS
jgi:hypothetical protein